MIIQAKPELSVVIVNYFSERTLVECLRSVENQHQPVEVIVVDNGSQPHRRAGLAAAHPAVVWHSMGGNAGFSAACNSGASRARSRKLLFLNPDTRVAAGSLGALARALDSRQYSGAILGCAIYDGDGSVQLSCRRFPNWKTFFAGRFSLLTRLFPANSWSADYLMGSFDRQSARRVDWVSGAALVDLTSGFSSTSKMSTCAAGRLIWASRPATSRRPVSSTSSVAAAAAFHTGRWPTGTEACGHTTNFTSGMCGLIRSR
jgi:hypothetical protein